MAYQAGIRGLIRTTKPKEQTKGAAKYEWYRTQPRICGIIHCKQCIKKIVTLHRDSKGA
jgi:hypothetical protein